jgi:predicted MFS family arabinose efflux permease
MPETDRNNDVRTLLLCGVALVAAMSIGRFAYTPIVPVMDAEVDLSNRASGIIASANHLGYLIGALVSAVMIRRLGVRRVLVIGLIIVSVATATMVVTDSQPLWAFFRLVVGVGSGFAFVSISAYIFAVTERSGRPDQLVLAYGGIGVGVVLSTLLIHVEKAAGWQSSTLWLSMGLISFACTALVMVGLPPDPPSAPAAQSAKHQMSPKLMWLTFGYGCAGFGYIITATYLVTIVRDAELGEGFETASWVAFGVAIVPSIRLWTAAAKRYGQTNALLMTFIVQAFGVGLLAFSTTRTAVIITGVVLGGSFVGLVTLALGQARIVASKSVNSALVVMTVAYGVGQIIGPTFAGWSADQTGDFGVASLVAAGVLFLGAAATAASDRSNLTPG